MANTDRPRGGECYGRIKQTANLEAGSACYPGDFLILASDGQVDPAAATNDMIGMALNYASAAAVNVLVSVDPEQVYVLQADEADIDAQTDIGQTADLLATAANTTYKSSRHELDSSSIGASQGFVILGIDKRPDNSLGTNVDCLVKINAHQIFGTDDFSSI